MPSTNATSREPARDLLSALLTAKLVGATRPVKMLFGFDSGAWWNQAPAVIVRSAGSKRKRRFVGGLQLTSHFAFHVLVIVPDAESGVGAVFTEQVCDDTLDEIERLIANCATDNEKSAQWQNMRFEDAFTEIVSITRGGKAYKQETIVLVCGPVNDIGA